VALRTLHRDLQGGGARVADDQCYGFDELFFFSLFFLLEKYNSTFLFVL